MERIRDMDSKQRSCICARHVEPQRHQSMDKSVRIELAASIVSQYCPIHSSFANERLSHHKFLTSNVADTHTWSHTQAPSSATPTRLRMPTHYKVVLWLGRCWSRDLNLWPFGQQNCVPTKHSSVRPLFRHLVACCLPMLSAARCPDSLQQQLRRLYQSSGGYHWKWRQRSQCLWLSET